MAGELAGRGREMQGVQALLQQARGGTAVLILDGQAGIGKTTVCRAAAEAAAEAGFTVLTTAGAAAEMSLAWAGLADLLARVDQAALSALSTVHQRALRAVCTGMDGPGGDERLVAAAFRAALYQQSRRGPVLIIVDDAQWLDEVSRLALGFAARRVTGPVAILVAVRSDEPGADLSWLQPPDPQALARLTVGPLNRSALATIIGTRFGAELPRSVVTRVHDLSAGNPFYALELARAIADSPDEDLGALPPNLSGLVRNRIGALDARTLDAALTAAVALSPTVDLIAAALACKPDEAVEALVPLETRGVLVFDGPRVSFTHPLIAAGIRAEAEPAALRRAHRRLAGAVEHPEQRARHLALSTPHGDTETLATLDAAAENAAARGAYSTAAELVTLAIRNGGDDQLRRLRGAEYLLRAGSLDAADALLEPIVDDLPAGFMRAAGLMLLAAVRGYRDGLASTIGMLRRAVAEADDVAVLRTQALLVLALSVGIGGDMATCVQLAHQARTDAEATGVASLRSQALTLWAHVSFMYGLGTDSGAFREALDIGESDASAPIMLRPLPIYALNCAWTGRLEQARTLLADVSSRCAEVGNELDVLWAAEQLTMIEVGLGRYDDAERTAHGALDRAQLIGGRLPLITAYTAIANAAAYRGRVDDTAAAAAIAIDEATTARLGYLIRPPTMSLAFVQVSAGQNEEALQTLKPLLADFDPEHDTEIVAGSYLPDAVEALTSTGRADEAEPLVTALEENGVRLDRPWMLAVGARCRALVLAANGDADGALRSAEQAMEHHRRLPMPFERARTLVLLGQLQRRRRRTQAARESLSEAAGVFDELGSPLWSARAHGELNRLAPRPAGAVLTNSEQRVARYAAEGLSNKEIAAAMYLSVKTVEMYLSSAYRKLGVRSRTRLAERLRDGGTPITT